MENLPTDIIEKIMCDKILSLSDVINTLQTCKRLKSIIEGNNYIWKEVFAQSWPDIFPSIDCEEISDWFDEVKHFVNLKLIVSKLVARTSSGFTNIESLLSNKNSSEFAKWDKLSKERKFNDIYILYFLSHIYWDKTPDNVEIKGSIDRVFGHLHSSKCYEEFKELTALPKTAVTFEKCATLMAKSFQPFDKINYEKVRKVLDKLSLEAQDELRIINPKHPLFTFALNVQINWKDETLKENVFEGCHVVQIFEAVDKILYEKHNFHNLQKNDQTRNFSLAHSCIDKVLQSGCGSTILLSIIYESICRRLGIKSTFSKDFGKFIFGSCNSETNPFELEHAINEILNDLVVFMKEKKFELLSGLWWKFRMYHKPERTCGTALVRKLLKDK